MTKCAISLLLTSLNSFLCAEFLLNTGVFCWRHHKNPVGKTWRWAVDGPEMIVEEAIAKHVAMVKQLKGMPGLKMDRYAEAFTVRVGQLKEQQVKR